MIYLCNSFNNRENVTENRSRERAAVWKKRREKEEMGFWKAPSSRHQRRRSTFIRGPMELKFGREVHNT
jgi:hypothetical protein